MNLLTRTNPVTAKVFAVVTITALLLSAFPVAFFLAEASTEVYRNDIGEVSESSSVRGFSIDATNYTDIVVRFDYDMDAADLDGLEAGETVEYGYQITGGDFVTLGTLTFGSDPAAGSITDLALGAAVDGEDSVTFSFPVTGAGDRDQVLITNIVVTGELIDINSAVVSTSGVFTSAELLGDGDGGTVADSAQYEVEFEILPEGVDIFVSETPEVALTFGIFDDAGNPVSAAQVVELNSDVSKTDGFIEFDGLGTEKLSLIVEVGPLAPGNYRLEVLELNYSVVKGGETRTLVLDPADVYKTEFVTIGNTPDPSEDTMTISGYKYRTTVDPDDGDDITDQSNPLPDWVIELYTTDDVFVASTTTNIDGYYEFTEVGANDYRVREVLQPGWTQTQVEENDREQKEDFCQFEQPPLVVLNTQIDAESDDVLVTPEYRCDFYNRLNRDGGGDSYEISVEKRIDSSDRRPVSLRGWEMTFSHPDLAEPIVRETNLEGRVSFETDLAGEWTVTEEDRSGWAQLEVLQNGVIVDTAEGTNVCVFNVGNYDSEGQYDCEFTNTFEGVTITGTKYELINGDRVPVTTGWTINLEGFTGVVDSAITDAFGNYTLTAGPGDWVVSEEMPVTGWIQVGVVVNGGELVPSGTEPETCSLTFDPRDDDENDEENPDPDTNRQQTCDFINERIVEPEPEPERRSSGGSGTRVDRNLSTPEPTPLVAGATTVSTCPFLTDYMQMGVENDSMEVMKLQVFLNVFQSMFDGTDNPVTGTFGATTDANVKAFQQHFAPEILNPWYEQGIVPHNRPTGFVYKTTSWKINSIVCPDYTILPELAGEDLNSNVDLNLNVAD